MMHTSLLRTPPLCLSVCLLWSTLVSPRSLKTSGWGGGGVSALTITDDGWSRDRVTTHLADPGNGRPLR